MNFETEQLRCFYGQRGCLVSIEAAASFSLTVHKAALLELQDVDVFCVAGKK